MMALYQHGLLGSVTPWRQLLPRGRGTRCGRGRGRRRPLRNTLSSHSWLVEAAGHGAVARHEQGRAVPAEVVEVGAGHAEVDGGVAGHEQQAAGVGAGHAPGRPADPGPAAAAGHGGVVHDQLGGCRG